MGELYGRDDDDDDVTANAEVFCGVVLNSTPERCLKSL